MWTVSREFSTPCGVRCLPSPELLIGLHAFDGDHAAMKRQAAACEALASLDGIEAVNLQFTQRYLRHAPGLATLTKLVADSIVVTGSSGRVKPIALEMFDELAAAADARRCRYFAYINSDIIVTPALVRLVQSGGKETYAVSRCDVGGDAGDQVVTSGQDMFVVSVGWWQSNRARFRPYILGEACWDNVYTAIMMCHSDGALLNRDRLILHERHATVWQDATPAARYNGYLAALDARYFHLWSQYWHRLEALRAQGASESTEADLARATFVWRRSAPDAMRQLIRSARARRRYRRLREDWRLAAAGTG
jgi:hypothetical protein